MNNQKLNLLLRMRRASWILTPPLFLGQILKEYLRTQFKGLIDWLINWLFVYCFMSYRQCFSNRLMDKQGSEGYLDFDKQTMDFFHLKKCFYVRLFKKMDLSSYKDPIKYDNNRNYVWNRLHVWSSANMMISFIICMILCI